MTKAKKKSKPNGIVLYEGPSPYNGDDIVVIMTGLKNPSKNEKTGPMAQVWIMYKDRHPVEALNEGLDEAVCGTCPHRGDVCYVATYTTGAVWKAYQNGKYGRLPKTIVNREKLLGDKSLRWGAYGDPAFIPPRVIRTIQKYMPALGYTHQWRHCDPVMKYFLMASVDTPQEQEEAEAQGWRTFRVRMENEPLLPGEIACPADKIARGEMLTTCNECMLCNGKKGEDDNRKNIAVYAHGSGKKKFEKWRESLPMAV